VPASPTLAIVIVSYNARAELRRCLESIANQMDHVPTTIVVVDNGSQDGTAKMVGDEWPTVRFIQAGSNVGFARGNNVGIKATESEYVLLLNPDTILASDAIAVLIRGLAAHPEAAAAGPRLVDAHGSAELSFGWTIGPLGELRQKIVGTLYRQRWGPIVHRVEQMTREAGQREWVSGACLLVRRRDLEEVGLLDERYFMYTEDVDLCLALRKRGRAILFLPQAEVTHLRGRSAERNPRTEEMRRQSQLAYYAKHHPTWVPFLRLYLRLTGKGR
jgi:GT2 family glycosyltransferase